MDLRTTPFVKCKVAKVLMELLSDERGGARPSFYASSVATATPLSHNASMTICVLEAPPPTRSLPPKIRAAERRSQAAAAVGAAEGGGGAD
jgi:hypothetical protein